MRPMLDNDLELLKTASRTPDNQEIPAALEAAYWEYKRGRDAIDNSPIRPEEVALLVLHSGIFRGQGAEQLPDAPILELIKAGRVEKDAPISVRWRLGKPVVGTYKGYAVVRNKVLVVLPNEFEPREFDPEKIVGLPVPEPVEL
jgi:hypothetical protein